MGMQAMTKSGAIDFIKVDIEGEEKQLFEDRASWPALCEVRCIATEIHGWIAGAEEAFNTFLKVFIRYSCFVCLGSGVLVCVAMYSGTRISPFLCDFWFEFFVCTGSFNAKCLLFDIIL